MRIMPAPRARNWMDATDQSFANRCLPLLMANQHGWVITAGQSIEVFWRGGNPATATRVTLVDGNGFPAQVASHFGSGVITWQIPWLFRTPPCWNLLVKGPPNLPKDGVCYLEGLVETDWSIATFTYNIKITRPDMVLRFEKDEPICTIIPQQRAQLDEWHPQVVPMTSDKELNEQYNNWQRSRSAFYAAVSAGRPEQTKQGWQKHYMQGQTPTNKKVAEGHQTKQTLQPFSGG